MFNFTSQRSSNHDPKPEEEIEPNEMSVDVLEYASAGNKSSDVVPTDIEEQVVPSDSAHLTFTELTANISPFVKETTGNKRSSKVKSKESGCFVLI